MQVIRFESLTLIAAVIGAAVLDSGAHATGGASAAVGDLAILLALFAFDGTEVRSGAQSIAFGGASGFCLLAPLFYLAKTVLGVTPPTESSPWFLFGAWIVATVLMFGVDRFRMSSKDNMSLADAGLSGAAPLPILSTAQPTGYRPAPIRVEAVQTAPVAYAAPPVAASSFETQAFEPQPLTPQAAVSTSSSFPVPAEYDVLAIPPAGRR